MIYLNDKYYISRGLHRKCYIHPEDNQKCIKVNYNDGAEEETNREIAYYKHLIKRKINWDSLAKYYGPVETNEGIGHVFDLIRDADGQISTPLEHYLASEQLTEKYYDALVSSFKNLKKALLKDRIITMTIKSKNILFQHQVTPENAIESNGKNRLIIIDNIGNATFIPVANYLGFMATAKIERTWQRFLVAIINENKQNRLIKKLVQDINSN
ncbi:YrbL family protein [Orbaceae bacterium ESL0727]|nr:YrbL family protein [Orbaceae bacterium ESL0727]